MVVLFPAPLSLNGCGAAGGALVRSVRRVFPAWMFCAIIGIVGAALARAIFVGTDLAAVLRYQLLVCTADLAFGR